MIRVAPALRHVEPAAAPLVAGCLALLAVALGWRGVDFPAQLYRVGLFHRDGFTLWNSQWYGGHWTISYSVIFPPLAGVIGVQATEVASAAVAAWAFDRLVVGHFGRVGRVGSVVFAVGTLAEVAIGQLPFLLGEALALLALGAAARNRSRLALVLAVVASLASPLAGGFFVLAVVAWLVGSWPARRVQLACLAGAPAVVILGLGFLFPGQGAMPFPGLAFVAIVATYFGLSLIIPPRERALRAGAGLYLLAIVVGFVLPTPISGNLGRLGACLGVPLAVCVLWPHRRRLLFAAVIPLTLFQWSSAYATVTVERHDPSTRAGYFAPLLGFLRTHAAPQGRVEVVPTQLHWEVAYVAPQLPLARGWERQLDTADNPIFYNKDDLTAASYRSWLLDNGVRYVALPDVPLDYAGMGEARLVERGVPGLRLAWHNSHWRVYEVVGSQGIVTGPARLVKMDGGEIILDVTSPGTVVVNVRRSPRWAVTDGDGCLALSSNGSTALIAEHPGRFRLSLQLIPNPESSCGG